METQPQQIRLVWEDPTTGDSQEMTSSLPVTVGRGPHNTISLNSKLVSRYHARLEAEGDRIVIHDQNSINGILVNGRRVKHTRLSDGNSFQIGPFFFTIFIEAPAGVVSAPEIVVRWQKSDGAAQLIRARPPITLGRSSLNTAALPGAGVSLQHATVDFQNGEWLLIDHDSTTGTLLNGQPCTQAALPPANAIRIGEYTLTVFLPKPAVSASADATAITDPIIGKTAQIPAVVQLHSPQAELSSALQGDTETSTLRRLVVSETKKFPPPLFDRYQNVPVDELESLGLPLDEITCLTIGGGLGSFAWVDYLTISGVNPADVVAIGVEPKPYGRLRRLAVNAQIPPEERLRSGSDACPDNIWGWPGYAVREIWQELRSGNLSAAARIGWQIFGEPTLAETYTPTSGAVFASIDREASRIGWERIWRYGRVRAIRKTGDGRYVVAYSQTRSGKGRVHKLILTRYLHIAVGYPAVRFLKDLQEYRERTRDFKNVVNAFENHEHVYEHLIENGGKVLVRGQGIVASRILQRLNEARLQNPNISILHLMRAPNFRGNRYRLTRRRIRNHWEYQPLDWPKACWGGSLRFLLEKVDEQERDQLLNDWGGVTTSDRRDWIEIIETGIDEGWYQIQFGHVERVGRGENGKLATIVRGKTAIQGTTELITDFIIDATGMAARLESNPLLKDLVEHYSLPRSVKMRLKVSPEFEIAEMRNGDGRMFASGSITLGAPFAPVDSFLGLQYSAQRAVDHLARCKAPGVRRLTPLRSIQQWLRWAR
ncbi:MAG: FHA domain-containing protein, partial [Anaerolineales bacterium]